MSPQRWGACWTRKKQTIMTISKFRKFIPSFYEGDGHQRRVSYKELIELGDLFNEQVNKYRIDFESYEERQEALFDFILQYINGNDDPQIDYIDYNIIDTDN